jgi:hypothetical protein
VNPKRPLWARFRALPLFRQILIWVGLAFAGLIVIASVAPAKRAPSPHPLVSTMTSSSSEAASTTAPAKMTASVVVSSPAETPKPMTTSVGCHPLTNGGNCYEPGEFCRTTDHGASGLAGDGKAITCLNNNGWRWEPS